MDYRFPTTRSRAVLERLERVMPGGNTRSGVYFAPFPLALERGAGFRVWDADGNEFIDFLNNFTSLVHGHAHPQIVDAIMARVPRGTVFSSPTELQADLAERICDRFPSIERLRFTNSGSEANILAVRAARAATGREHIVLANQAYHGLWEQVSGSGSRNSGSGIPAAVDALVHSVPYNDLDALRLVMAEHGDRVACLLFEPVRGTGLVPATPAFLREARIQADRSGSLLILDEIITARLHAGGYQSIVDVQPDLTTLGKIIGGGLPVGAVGGRADIMELFDPRRSNAISHSGTYNGNDLTMAAGCVSLDRLPQEEVERINALGDVLRERLRALLRDAGIPLDTGGYGSLVSIVPAASALSSSDAQDDARAHLARLHREALEEGVYFAARGLLNTSTPMNAALIDDSVDRFSRAIHRQAEQVPASPVPTQ